jgi:hypothetical protein
MLWATQKIENEKLPRQENNMGSHAAPDCSGTAMVCNVQKEM